MQNPADPPFPPAGPAFDEARVLDALWQVVATRGWHDVTFARIAAESGVGLDSLRSRYGTPMALLAAHARAVDRQVLSTTIPGQGGSARDRIFDLLMRRFDALQPHRAGILRLQADLRRHPLLALSLSPLLMASMAWTLEGAEVDTSGVRGLMRVQGLAGVWLAASRSWADDNSLDLGPTMAALDKALDRAEQIARTLRLDDGDLSAAGHGGIVPGQDAAPSPPAGTAPMLG
ncbi:MAG: TetR family transcriptional regulator [Roseomonas mucosa]|nr:TetR family transcriptional regulator [Roseomonas mucosa]